jgi:hypothetical protein
MKDKNKKLIINKIIVMIIIKFQISNILLVKHKKIILIIHKNQDHL